MLVEDDNNLREIYEARLLAEGYEIVSAKDGEEALALAVKEKPDLIISDVMMPKISGFDMLDILRSTPETKNTKVIMMTALSQAEDKARADKLGADRYLVKSQVTLEDVAKVAHEVLSGEEASEPATIPGAIEPAAPAAPAPEPVVTTAAPTPDPAPAPTPDPIAPPAPDPAPVADTPATDPAPAVDPVLAPTEAEESAQVEEKIKEFENLPVTEAPAEVEPTEAPVADAPAPEAAQASDTAPVAGKKIIEPLAAEAKPDLNELVAQEEAKENEGPKGPTPPSPAGDPGTVAL